MKTAVAPHWELIECFFYSVFFLVCAYLVLRPMLERTFTSLLHLETRKTVESLGSMNNSTPSVVRFCAGAANRVERCIEES